MKKTALFYLICTLLVGCNSNGDDPSAGSNGRIPATVEVYTASGLAATIYYTYDTGNMLTKIEHYRTSGIKNIITDIQYDGSGRPSAIETFDSGIRVGAKGITWYSHIFYSDGRIDSVNYTSSEGDEYTTNYTYFEDTRTYRSETPGYLLPPAFHEFTENGHLKQYYYDDGRMIFDISYSSEQGLFADAAIPVELRALLDGEPHYFFSAQEVTSVPVYFGDSSYELKTTRDGKGYIQQIAFLNSSTEDLDYRIQVTYR